MMTTKYLACFDKQDRLLNSADFKQVFDNPIKKVHSDHLIAFLAKSDQGPRLGLAITKKKLKTAVERNGLKRQAREYFRQAKHELPKLDIVIIVKLSYGKDIKIGDEVAELIRKIKKLEII